MPHEPARRGRGRPSLSDWYARPEEDEDDAPDSHGGNSLASCTERYSPTKRRRPPVDLDDTGYFIGDQSFDSELRVSPNSGHDPDAVVRSVCAVYFENNVSPILRYVQQSQENINSQLVNIREQLSRKIEATDVMTDDAIVELVSKETSRRVEACARQLEGVTAAVERKVELDIVLRLEDEIDILRAEVSQATAKRESRIAAVSAASASGDKDRADVKNLQVVIAAAGLRFDRQLKELRQQVNGMRSAMPSHENLWPGRVIGACPGSPAGSDVGSVAASLTGSFTGSFAGSTKSMGGEEQAEMKKMRAIVGAAGTVFSRDMRELRKDLHEVREQVAGLKGAFGGDGRCRGIDGGGAKRVEPRC